MLVADVWSEQQPDHHRFARLAGQGSFTMTGGHLTGGQGQTFSEPQFELHSFNGNFTLSGVSMLASYGSLLGGNGTNTKAFFSVSATDMDCHLGLATTPSIVLNSASPAASYWVSLSNTKEQGCPVGTLDQQMLPTVGSPVDATYREMLQQIRAERPQQVRAPVPHVSGVRADRVYVWQNKRGVVVDPI